MSGPVTRYHAVLVVLHWLLGAIVIGMLGLGFLVLARMPNNDPGKIAILRIHMAMATPIVLLLLARIVTRLVTGKPAPAPSGFRWADRLTPAAHWTLYLLIPAMVATGFATAITSQANVIVFGPPGRALPPDFGAYPSFRAHALLASALALLVTLHVAAALYHQFVLRDGLFRRMAFGKRRPA